MKRGELWYADFGTGQGSEQSGNRPVLIIQNDVGNEFSPTVIVAAITDREKRYMPTHLIISRRYGLAKDSVIMFEQIRTIDKNRLSNKLGELPVHLMNQAEYMMKISLGLVPVREPKKPRKDGKPWL